VNINGQKHFFVDTDKLQPVAVHVKKLLNEKDLRFQKWHLFHRATTYIYDCFTLTLKTKIYIFFKVMSVTSFPDPGSGAFLTPGSVIRERFCPDLGSDHYF